MAAAEVFSMPSMPSMSSMADPSFEQTILQFLEEEKHTDASFRVKCGEDWIPIRAHRFMLSMWSPPLADMFFGPDADILSREPIDITDVSPEIFRTTVRFAYGDVCNIDKHKHEGDIGFFVKLFRAAQLYQIEALSIICVQNVDKMKPTVNNVFQLLQAVRLMPVDPKQETEKKCLDLLESETGKVLASLDLCDVTFDQMKIILDLKRVSLESEFDLVMWLFAWAKNEQLKKDNTRSFKEIVKTKDVLGRVDLTRMEAKKFGELLANHEGVFDHEEIAQIFRNIVHPGCCSLPPWAGVVDRQYKYCIKPTAASI